MEGEQPYRAATGSATWEHHVNPSNPMAATHGVQLSPPPLSALGNPSLTMQPAEGRPLRGRQVACIYLGIFVPICAFLAIYSTMGEGIEVYSSLSREGNYAVAWYMGLCALAFLSFLWLTDAFDDSITRNSHKRLVVFLALIPLCMLFVASLLAVEEYISAPLVLFVLFKCLAGKAMRDVVCPYNALSTYMRTVALGNLVAAGVVIVAWVVWMLAFDHEWSNTEMFSIYHEKLKCNRATDTLEVGRCQAAYLLWSAPLIIGLLCFFFGMACLYLSREGSAVRMLIVQVLVLGMGLWVSMSISGAEMGLADDILQFCLLFSALFVVICVNIIGTGALRAKLSSLKIAAKMGEYSQSDFSKAALIVLTAPIMPLFLGLSIATRKARIVGFSLAPQLAQEDEGMRWFTASTWRIFKWLFSNTTSVLTWASYLCIFYFTCDVGVGKGATLFLGYMISIMKELHWAVMLLSFTVLGVTMFMLPPIPGPPVYLTGGVLVVGALEDTMGFWGATALCIVLCWGIKLVSCMLQQKVFGENMRGNVGVRYAVGINSVQMRAIRYCLMQPGFTMAKVAILCGGPDWPTSVLCGILGVSWVEAMLGTSPVLVLYLGYTVLAGAFQLKIGGACVSASAEDDSSAVAAALGVFPPSPPPNAPSPPPFPTAQLGDTNYWQMASAVALGVAMISMSCTSFAAVYFMEDTIENKKKECEAFPTDEEVEARERKVAEKQTAYKLVTKWTSLPSTDRYLLGGSVLFMTAACHLAGNFGGGWCRCTLTLAGFSSQLTPGFDS